MSIKAQPSKFAVLAVESSSDSEEEWVQVKGSSKAKASVTGKAEGSGAINKPQSKNAKKRARKRKNQQVEGGASDEGGKAGAVQDHTQRTQEVDNEFERELAEALVLSRLEEEAQAKLDREQQRKAAAAISGRKQQKVVTLTLQELHQARDLTKARLNEPQQQPAPDPHFFERLEKEVLNEIKRERHQAEVGATTPESVRVAQLSNEVEKRDAVIVKLKVENESLTRQLQEVKERNQSLCKILSQGEFSNTAELLQRLEQLNSVKQELTTEVNTLSSSLEQERSKNKQLKAELVKLQGKSNNH